MMNSLDFDEVVVEHQNSQGEKEDVSLTDETVLIEIFRAYDSIIANETSEPMGYPRFLIKFQKDGFSVADWSIDGNQVTSGSQFGRGNRKITNSETIYDSIYKVFLSRKTAWLGTYINTENTEYGYSGVVLADNNEFIFSFQGLSYSATGKYVIEGTTLTLTVNEEEIYTFILNNGTLIFESGKWAEKMLEKGAVFELSYE